VSRPWREVLLGRISALLDNISSELEYGSLVQLFVPRLQSQSVVLVTHRDFTRVNTVHDQKFWKYHETSCAFFFNISPMSAEAGIRRHCPLRQINAF
jgi:hypothetical protein